jgi:protein-S-isoprenylcysteine O-methyltransferase Ste14
MLKSLNLKVPPVVVGVLVGLAQWGVSRSIPELAVDIKYQGPMAVVVMSLGVVLLFFGTWSFKKHATTVNPLKPGEASTLVTSGIYSWTRNPMYLGMMILLIGTSIHFGNIGATATVLLFWAYITQFQIKPEEAILTDLFPDDFPLYCESTRRWM